ncbi:hypothetical protein OH77DRAFT_1519902 [Trametes cingulata]|nr:hypothetical protein OH77DRAFT_1519902 [Trametes cingulata]
MAYPLAHPLWSIAEVVREVMKQSADDPGVLTQCARVSRAFSEPALEVLWEKLWGLDRLLALLPSSFKKVSRGLSGDSEDDDDDAFGFTRTTFVLVDSIKDEEWARVAHYARLVRTYTSKYEKVDGLATAVLLEKLQGQPLFPRLKYLSWHRPYDLSALLPLFLSPMLRSISLDLLEGGIRRFYHDKGTDPTPSEYAYGTALQMIRSRAPQLEDVELFTSAFPCSINRLRDFEGVQSLNLHSVRNEGLVLEICSSLPHLKKLNLQLARRYRPEPPPSHLPERTLPSLTRLDINGAPLATVNILASISAPNLRSTYLAFEAVEEQWKRCIELLVSRFGSSLRQINGDLDDVYDEPERDPFSFHEWFSPLYALRKLVGIRFDSRFETAFDITANDVDNMATAWPKLRVLGIPTVQTRPSALPITSLQTIAEKCPRMELLIFPVPHHWPLDRAKAFPVRTQQLSMKEIRFLGGHWPLSVYGRCMAYVQRLFPCADTIRFEEDFSDTEDEEEE